jgi:V/A-type H+-transporting ATPase subunit E
MEVQLEHLIEKIKREGVEAAEQDAQKIIDTAREKARKMVEDAQKQAELIKEQAHQEAQKTRENSEMALKNAARNTLLLVKEQIGKMFEKVLIREVRSELNPDFLPQLIEKVVAQWQPDSPVEVSLSENDKQKLADVLLQRLQKHLTQPVIIKTNPNLTGGFRISKKGDAVAFDFSDEAIAETLSLFLNDKMKQLLKD